jgi:DNA polymerase-3 subunit alpha
MHPWLDELLKPTYGVIVYQEQVMQIAQMLAGYSLGGADLLRRAMGKKKPEEMDKQKAPSSTARSRRASTEDAERIFELLEFFAGLRLQQEPLGGVRAGHLPDGLPQGALPARVHGGSDVVRLGQRRQHRQVHRRGPGDGPGGRAARRQRVGGRLHGHAAAGRDRRQGDPVRPRRGQGRRRDRGRPRCIESRARTSGKFGSLFEICRRVDTQKCNRQGARGADQEPARSTARSRATATAPQLLGALDSALEQRCVRPARSPHPARPRCSRLLAAAPACGCRPRRRRWGRATRIPRCEPWGPKQLLAFEKEALGFYISGHPLDRYRGDLQRYASGSTGDFSGGRRSAGDHAIGGIVSQYREMITKKGDKMARFMLEDTEGTLEVIAFPKTFEKVRHVLVSDEPILCNGAIKNEGNAEASEWKMFLEDAVPIAQLRAQKTSKIDIHLNADSITKAQVEELRSILMAAPRGVCQAVVRLTIPQRSEIFIALGDKWLVAPSDELLARLERVFGDRVATLA